MAPFKSLGTVSCSHF